jgi:hypothetical protein
MTAQRCGNCRHYDPTRNPETGRARPSEPGRCLWKPLAWPTLAASYVTVQWGGQRAPNWPTSHTMYSHSGEDCKTWERKK